MSIAAMSTCWDDPGGRWTVPWIHGCPKVSAMTVRVVALAIADVVNDMHQNEFFASFGTLAGKVGCHRNTVRRVVRHLCVTGVLLEIHRGRPGLGQPGSYRWIWWPGRVEQTSENLSTGSRRLRDPSRNSARGGSRTAARQNAIRNATDVRAPVTAADNSEACPVCDGDGWITTTEGHQRTATPCPECR